MHRVLIAVSPAHTTRSCSFLCHVQPRLQKQQQSQLPTGPVASSQSQSSLVLIIMAKAIAYRF